MKYTLYKLFILSAVVAFVVTACQKDVTLDLPQQDPKVVVEGWIETNTAPVVFLSSTFFPYGTYDLLEQYYNLYSSQPNAVVSVTSNAGVPVTLKHDSLKNFPQELLHQIADNFGFQREILVALAALHGLPEDQQIALIVQQLQNLGIQVDPADFEEFNLSGFNRFLEIEAYYDTSNAIVGQPLGSYQLEITLEDGSLVTSQTTIPILQPIDSLTYEVRNDSMAQVLFNITVPENFDEFVRFSNRRNLDPFYFPDYLFGSTADNGFYAGEGNVALPVLRGYSQFDDVETNNLGLFKLGDLVTVKWHNIDEATYNFWFSSENDGGDSPFSSPTRIQTNINGGFGIWAGYGVSYTSIQLPN